MPVIGIRVNELVSLSGLKKDTDWFASNIPMVGASFEGMEGENMRFEFFPNRPDHYSVEGIARTLSFLHGGRKAKQYQVKTGKVLITVESSVENIRPVIVCAVARNADLYSGALSSLIELQEKLHLTVGRRRKKVSIGLHNIDAVTPPFTYCAVESGAVRFVPLGMDETLSPGEIIEKHEKGREYGWIVGNGPYPLLADADENVLSMPPIINGNVTTLSEESRNIFIDVTGTNQAACNGILNILCANLADRGASIESVTVRHAKSEFNLPDLNFREMKTSARKINKVTGLELTDGENAECLRKMGYRAEIAGRSIVAGVPPYRLDILHEVDLAEDVAIAYGFDRFGLSRPRQQTSGRLLTSTGLSHLLSELMSGYGYVQCVTFMLASSKSNFEKMRLEPEETVTLLNPVTEDTEIMRTSLLPGLFRLLEANKHNELPQKVFEIGHVQHPERRMFFAALNTHPRATFSEAKSLIDALGRDLKQQFTYAESSDPRFIGGRQMCVTADGGVVGYVGEIHPEIITNFNLFSPVVGLELDVTGIQLLR